MHIPNQTPRIESTDLCIRSLSGNTLRATISEARAARYETGIVLCPGLAVGKEGEFVRLMETALLESGNFRFGIRFNFSGHEQDTLNRDLQGFTFGRAVHDFKAAVNALRDRGMNRVVAVGSSTGVQQAILASCQSDGSHADLIVGRSSVIDCFKSVVSGVPDPLVKKWLEAGTFEFPVGDQSVRLSADLLRDIAAWNLPEHLSRLKTPVHLIHGSADKTVPLGVVQRILNLFPVGIAHLHVLDGEGHDLSNDSNSQGFRWMVERAQMINQQG